MGPKFSIAGKRVLDRRGNLITVDFGGPGDQPPPTPKFPGAAGSRVFTEGQAPEVSNGLADATLERTVHRRSSQPP
jgi:hypothetical protein